MNFFDRLQTRMSLGAILLVSLPLLLSSVIVSLRTYTLLRQDAQESLMQYSEYIAAEIDIFITGRSNTLEYAARLDGIAEDEQTALLNSVLAFDTDFQEVAMLDADGMELERVSRTWSIPNSELRNRAGTPEYRAIVEEGQPIYYSNVRFDSQLRESLMTISTPIIDRRTGELTKVLVADFRFRAVQDLLTRREGQTTYVLDQRGEIVAHDDLSIVLGNVNVTIPNESVGRFTQNGGREVFFATSEASFGAEQLIVVAEQSVEEAMLLAADIRTIAGVILAISLIVGILPTLEFVRRIVNPIEALSVAAQQIAAGDLSARTNVTGRGEIAKLANSFNSMAAQLKQSMAELETSLSDLTHVERALRTKHTELESFFLLVPSLLAISDTDGRLLQANQAWEDVLGYPPQKLTGTLLLDYIHPDDRERVEAYFSEMVEQNQTIIFNARCQTQSGDYRVIQWNKQPANGYIYIVAQDITQQQEHEAFVAEHERLKASFQREREQNRFIHQVVSMLSHDLRTPLAVIQTSTDLLSRYETKISREERSQKFIIIERQVEFILEILEDTVKAARGKLSQREFQPTPINIDTLCRVSVEEIVTARSDAAPVVFVNRSDVRVAMVDEVLLSRILINLLSNAVKYSPRSDEVRLELDKDEDHLIIRVIDHGIGIPESDLKRIFESFYRTRNAQDFEGSGLGLAIVQDCVERHGGQITVTSQLDKGTTFTVYLPPAPESVQPASTLLNGG